MKRYSMYHQARWQSFEGQDAPTVSDLLTLAHIDGVLPHNKAQRGHDEKLYREKRKYAIDFLDIGYLLKRKIIHLSHGESRKVHIARALIQSPQLIILDSPFIGLDDSSRKTLRQIIEDMLAVEKPNLLFVTSHPDEIPKGVTHVLYLENCRISAQGEKQALLSSMPRHQIPEGPPRISSVSSRNPSDVQKTTPSTLVKLTDVNITYGDVRVLQHINWQMNNDEHWAILGPNGSGKTTLLSLVLADNPQSYANDIALFGTKRGSGESIWDIKQRIGYVSPELHIYYHSSVTCFQVVCSGFFNSIGLYKKCSSEQLDTAANWMKSLAIEDVSDRIFSEISAGEQRQVLLCRAMVKQPELLVLDEPCQGLDTANRNLLLQQLSQLCNDTAVRLIFTTHHLSFIPHVMTHVLKLDRGRVAANGPRKDILGW